MSTSRALPLLLAAVLLVTAALPAANAQETDQPPTVEIEAPPEGATVNGTTTVEGNASDPEGNLSDVEVRIDDGPWTNATGTSNWTYEWDTTQHADGDHAIHARSYDGRNYSEIDTRNATVENGGNESEDGGDDDAGEPPSVTIETPVEGATVNGTTEIQGTASDPDGNVTSVRVRVDDAPWKEASGTDEWTASWDTTSADDGEHTITVEAADDDNRTATVERTVTVDNGDGGSTTNEAPQVSIDEPASGATVNGTLEVQGTALDPDGSLEEVQARIDDGFWSPVNGTTDWSFPWDTTVLDDGEHVLAVKAVDADGATANATLTVNVDNSQPQAGPEVEIRAPAPDATVNGTLELRGNASDPDGVVDGVEVRLGDEAWRPARGTNNWELEWNVSELEPGPQELQVRAFDDDGNRANASRTIEVEEVEPLSPTGVDELTLSLTSPEDGASLEDELVIAGEVQDVGDPNATVRVTWRIDDGRARVLELEGGGSFEQDVNVSGLSPGEHELTVEAIHGERSSDAHTRTFEVDEGGPPDVASPKTGLALLVVAVLAGGGLILWARR